MDYVYVVLGTSTMWLFMYKIEWLFSYKSYVINLCYDVMLFAVSFLLINYHIGNPKFLVALRMPLISSIIFRVLYIIFIKIYKRDPENTFWVFEKKPVEDVIFSMLFWILGVGLPVVLVF